MRFRTAALAALFGFALALPGCKEMGAPASAATAITFTEPDVG